MNLNEVELKNLNNFLKQHDKCSGLKFSIKFKLGPIGKTVYVKCKVCDKKLGKISSITFANITDHTSW